MKNQRAFSVLQLPLGVAVILFIAGVAVPSLLRSWMATSHALAAGSLHSINFAGISFSYRYQNIAFALLGALVGTATALAIASSGGWPGRNGARRIWVPQVPVAFTPTYPDPLGARVGTPSPSSEFRVSNF